MRRLATGLLLVLAAPVAAHDFWLDLPSYRIAEGGALPLRFLIGDTGAAEPWETLWRKVVSLRSYGPGGVVDQQATIREGEAAGGATLTLRGEGTHVVAFESAPSENDLPADEFTAYAEHEGLTPALEARRRAGTTGARGRELYSRRAKALVQVGATPSDDATRPIGLTLEIVPERNPYALAAGTPLPLRIYWRGRPLAGASLAFEPLDNAKGHATPLVSDATGLVTVPTPATGRWRAAVVWTTPTVHPRAEWNTMFASLTFGR